MINNRYSKRRHINVPNNLPDMTDYINSRTDISTPPEIWRMIEPWMILNIPVTVGNRYFVSTYGRIYSEYRNPIIDLNNIRIDISRLKPLRPKKGSRSLIFKFNVNGQRTEITVQKVVMLAFCFRPDCEELDVRHIDGNYENNCLWNLAWVSAFSRNKVVSFDEATDIFLEVQNELQRCLSYNSSIDIKSIYTKIGNLHNISSNHVKAIMEGRANSDVLSAWDNNAQMFNPFIPI